jgi:hypothetical protein
LSPIESDLILSEVLDMVESADNKQRTELEPSIDLKSDLFSGISDEELLKATQLIEQNLNATETK